MSCFLFCLPFYSKKSKMNFVETRQTAHSVGGTKSLMCKILIRLYLGVGLANWRGNKIPLRAGSRTPSCRWCPRTQRSCSSQRGAPAELAACHWVRSISYAFPRGRAETGEGRRTSAARDSALPSPRRVGPDSTWAGPSAARAQARRRWPAGWADSLTVRQCRCSIVGPARSEGVPPPRRRHPVGALWHPSCLRPPRHWWHRWSQTPPGLPPPRCGPPEVWM